MASANGHSLPLFRLFDIEIRLDISVLLIFGLIAISLGNGLLPLWHPDWTGTLIWGTALFAAVLFFASLLAHELAHSVVAKHYGIPVPRITLFIFGGMAEIEREPDRPGIEFLVAIAGPLMSLAISFLCSNVAYLFIDDEAIEALASGSADAFSTLGPLTTTLIWLSAVNFVLAIFNMIPGFPMDGGRVFRAIIWGWTGDQLKATRWASNIGRYFGYTLMAIGFLEVFTGAGLGGLWYVLIGWFISNLAAQSYRSLQSDRVLKGIRVRDLMRTHFETVSARTSVASFIDDYLLRSSQHVWPVIEGDSVTGFVTLHDVTSVNPATRNQQSVSHIARPLSAVPTLSANSDAREVLQGIAEADIEALPVFENGQLVGLISRGDVVRWMSLHELA